MKQHYVLISLFIKFYLKFQQSILLHSRSLPFSRYVKRQVLQYVYFLQGCDVERGIDNQKGSELPQPKTCKINTESSAVEKLRCHSLLDVFKRTVVILLVLAVFLSVWYLFGWMVLIELIVIASVAFFVAGGALKWLKILYKTLPRDLT